MEVLVFHPPAGPMSEQPPLPAPSLEQARTEVGRVLSDHFAEDRIDVDEFERRLELTFKATTVEGVRAQLEGLTDASSAPQNVDLDEASMPEETRSSSRSKTLVAFMSGVARRGAWSVPTTVNVIAFMGGVELDLRRGRLAPGITNINVFALMGGVEITVPPHVRVETDGMAFMGAFEDRGSERGLTRADAPVVRVTGLAVMGGVEVRVKVVQPERDE
jgi:hypothetical protein